VPLIIAGTPIGNVDDASPRLRAALGSADVVAAEDTRRLRRLAAALDITVAGRLVSYYDAVERERTESLLDDLRAGRTVLLVTDAGTPLVSDPGHRLVAAAAAEALAISVLPGPSAALAALAVAGLPADRWCFEGFLARRAGDRRRRLAELATEPRTLVFFEAPHRAAPMLRDLADALGAERPAVACRELTKTYEEVRRATLADLADWAAAGIKGELTIVVGGAPPRGGVVPASEVLATQVAELVEGGLSKRDAVDAVAAEHGISRRQVYASANRV